MTPGRSRHLSPVWQDATGHALVRYAPTGSPTTSALHLSGEFDAHTVGCLHEAIGAVRTSQTERLLLDLTGVTFGDAAFVRELSATHDLQLRLVLIGPLPSPVRLVLDITGTPGQVLHRVRPDSRLKGCRVVPVTGAVGGRPSGSGARAGGRARWARGAGVERQGETVKGHPRR
ncbi:STAS domain-containing protein [Streptomyces sp. NPDC056463]|uniref:STAS domain-containing protein n=1 Tax=Streptomyces sp. NPDC056463 TaxID=3345827 RepID=UPI0036A39840